MRTGRSTPPLLIMLGGFGIAIGACLPWMYSYAGLVPLRGVIGLNGRLLLVAGALCVVLGVLLGRGTRLGSHVVLQRVTAALGMGITGVAAWLLIGVRELAGSHGPSAMLVLRPGPGLFVVGLGGVLVALAGCLSDGQPGDGITATPGSPAASMRAVRERIRRRLPSPPQTRRRPATTSV